ncbi:unnamed protein product, partial [Prorocentrum cordatum]
ANIVLRRIIFLALVCIRRKVHFVVANPCQSALWSFPLWRALCREHRIRVGQDAMCNYAAGEMELAERMPVRFAGSPWWVALCGSTCKHSDDHLNPEVRTNGAVMRVGSAESKKFPFRWTSMFYDIFAKYRSQQEPYRFAAPAFLGAENDSDFTKGLKWLEEQRPPSPERDPVEELSSVSDKADPIEMLSDDAEVEPSNMKGAATRGDDGEKHGESSSETDSAVRQVRQFEADEKLAQSFIEGGN